MPPAPSLVLPLDRFAFPGITFTHSLNDAAENAQVDGDKLTLMSQTSRDNYRDPAGKLSNNTGPAVLVQTDNRRPLTLVARVAPKLLSTYDAGALYIWIKDDTWVKMAMERDERDHSRIITVRTIGTSDDNGHDVVTVEGVYMKISSDTKSVGLYYSLDNRRWQLVRIFKNDYPAQVCVGVGAQSPLGSGTSVLFEDINLVDNSVADFHIGI